MDRRPLHPPPPFPVTATHVTAFHHLPPPRGRVLNPTCQCLSAQAAAAKGPCEAGTAVQQSGSAVAEVACSSEATAKATAFPTSSSFFYVTFHHTTAQNQEIGKGCVVITGNGETSKATIRGHAATRPLLPPAAEQR